MCLLIYFGVGAQDKNSYKITGTITSKETKKPLESATVYITKVGYSIPFRYIISDKKGQFLLEGKTLANNVMLVVSFYGYKNYLKQYRFSAKNNLKLPIALEDKTQELDEVTLKYITPIIIKNDTLIINPKAFNMRKRANIEDLLKKIPGFKVDTDGSIKIHGDAVSKKIGFLYKKTTFAENIKYNKKCIGL